jgi:aminoglycoside phosphotransferase family enzyme
MVSVELANGDNVGAVEPWTWPDAFSDVTRNDLEAVQRAVAAGEYRESHRAKDWVGNAVADVLNLDVSDAYVRAKVRHMLSTWIDNDALRVIERPDRTRMMRKFVVVGTWASEGEIDE